MGTKEYHNAYYKKHKVRILKVGRLYIRNNREKNRKYQREYYKKNKIKIKEQRLKQQKEEVYTK